MQIEKGRLALGQFTILALLFTIGDPILIIPSVVAEYASMDAWISGMLATAIGLAFLWLYQLLYKLYPQHSLVEMYFAAFGRTAGRVIAAAALLPFWLLLAASLIREISDFLTTQIMPETPVQAIEMIIVGVALYGLWLGIEPVARTAQILFPWVILLSSMLFLFLAAEFKLPNLEPVLKHGLQPILRGSYPMTAIPFLEVITLLMLTPYVAGSGVSRRMTWGVFVGGLFIVLITLLSILSLGPDITSRSMYPSFVMAKKIRIGDFLERMEILITIMWMITIYIKLAISMYAFLLGTAQITQLRSYKPLLLPTGMLLVILAQLITPNIVAFADFTTKIWPLYAYTVCLLLPGMVWVVGKVREMRKMRLKESSAE